MSRETLQTPASLRIVVPAKNEAQRIAQTIVDLCGFFGDRANILVVANGCTDGTVDIVRQLSEEFPQVSLLEVTAPIGKGGALRAGLTLGREPFLAFVDADGSTSPDQVAALMQHCEYRRLDGAIGSRWLPGSTISRKQPLQRRLASRAFNLLVRGMFGLPYTDTQCGAKVFARVAIDRVFDRLELANFAFDVDLLVTMKFFDFKVEEIPIAWGDVPDFSKVMLIRAGSSMALALLRLWVRNSIFRNLPWADLIARGSVIPVQRGLNFLVLVRGPMKAESLTLLNEIQSQGHNVEVRSLHTPLDSFEFFMTYFRSGHRTCDVIADFIGPNGSRFSAFSTKPKIYWTSIVARSHSELPELVRTVAKRCGYSALLWRIEEGWALSHPRASTSLQEFR